MGYTKYAYKNPPIIFEKLKEIDIYVPQNDRFNSYYCWYNFEAYFSQKNLLENGVKLTFKASHISLSVGIAANAPDFKKGVCFVTNRSEAELIQKMLDYLEKVSDTVY